MPKEILLPISDIKIDTEKKVRYYNQQGEIVTDKILIAEHLRLLESEPKGNANIIDWSNPENRF